MRRAIHTGLIRVMVGLAGAAAFGGCLVFASTAQAVAPTAPQFTPIRFFLIRGVGTSAMSSPRVGAAAAITDGKVLIAGGSAGTTTPPKTMDLFNPAAHTQGAFQELTTQLNTPRQYGYAAPLPGGKVLIGGGTDQNNVDLASAEVYDPATGTVVPLPTPMTTPRRDAWAAPLHDGRVLIGVGIDANNNILRSAEIFDPTTRTFTAVAQQMVDPLSGATATTLPDGRVLIAGGMSSTTTAPRTAVEIYQPTTGAFTKPPEGMLVPRAWPVVVTLPDGKVLIAGGMSSPLSATPNVVERSAEIFDPEDSTSQELPVSGSTEVTTARYAATAALLPNGRVLIAGGGNSVNQPLANAELFESAPEATVTNPNFGDHATGTTSTLSVTITNVGAQNLDVEGFSFGGPNPDDFSVGASTCPGTPFGFEQTCKVNVHFTPSATGSRVATLRLSDNEPVPLTFIIKGAGMTPNSGSGGGNGGSGSGGNGGSGSPNRSPVLSKVTISPHRFHAGPGPKTGTTISWHDTETATTTLKILRPVTGRRSGRRCTAITHANRSHRPCIRDIKIGSLTHHDHAGKKNALHFSGRLRGRKLKPGHYRLTLQAVNHRRSRAITETFTITT